MTIFEGSENSLLLNVDDSERSQIRQIKENFMVELWTNFATHHHNPTPVEIACLAYGVKGTFTSQNWFLNWMLTVKKTSTVLKRFLKNFFVSLCAAISYVVGKRLCLILTSRIRDEIDTLNLSEMIGFTSVFPIFENSPKLTMNFV